MIARALAFATATALLAACADDGPERRDTPTDAVADAALDADDAGDDAGPRWFVALPNAQPIPGVTVRHAFDRAGGLLTAPFPSEDLRRDGTIDVSAWPNPDDNAFVTQIIALTAAPTTPGFGRAAAVYWPLDGAIDAARLPDVHASITDAARVFVVSVDPADPDRGRRTPILVDFAADAGPYGAPNLLAALPLQGVPLRPDTLYAAVVTRDLQSPDGAPLGRDATLADLLAGRDVARLTDAARGDYDAALASLVADAGVDPSAIAGLAVFRTGAPASAMAPFVAAARAEPTPTPGAFELTDAFDDFCVFRATLDMPTWQHGTPPYTTDGGAWRYDADGAPLLAGHERARVFVTIPRTAGPMPAEGWPTVVFIRTGGGGDRPLVDRGPRATNGGEAIAPGTGPALHFARAGFAGVMIDGPHGGPRNVSNGDEQFLMFNVLNPPALRDNVRQTALETVITADIVAAMGVDTSACAGAGAEARFDDGHLALMGHSMGGWVAVPTLAFEPRYGAVILSGAGGSWVDNVVYKELPLEVAPLADAILGYTDRHVGPHDPAVNLLQWAGEVADPQAFGARAAAHGAHVLMLQGVVDHYILPPIANATSLALALDLAGPALDADVAELDRFAPLTTLLPLVDAEQVALPVTGNDAEGARTRVVVQHAADGIEDGHEIAFQTEGARHQYRCFLTTWLRDGTPTVPIAGGVDDDCE